MFNKIGLIGLATASAALVFFACGGEGGGEDIRCTADTDCRVGEICHPDAKVCVQTCTSSADCPDASKTCAPLVAGDTSGTQICKCTTTPLCQGGPAGASSVCSDQYDVCVPSCTGNTDCPSGQTCDTATSTCVGGTTGCTMDTDCASGQTCNTATGVCEGGNVTCDASQTQPAACSYGQFCSGGTCTAVSTPTCDNFQASAHGASWTTSAGGPITYSVEKVSGMCGGMFDVRVRAYRTSGSFPSTRTTLAQEVHVVRPDGSEIDASTIIDGTTINVTNAGKNIEFLLRMTSASCPYSVGVHFNMGNEACASIQ